MYTYEMNLRPLFELPLRREPLTVRCPLICCFYPDAGAGFLESAQFSELGN
jgi:hypothetical protein